VVERLRYAGLLSAAVLAAWLSYEVTREPAIATTPASAQAGEIDAFEVPDLEVEPPDLLTLRATLERPLFDDDRRPDEEEVQVDSGPLQPAPVGGPPLVLSAVIVDEEGSRSALLQTPGEKLPKRVLEGEEVGGWRLEEIRDDGVVLTANGRRTEMPLRVFEAPPPPRPARPVPTRQTRQIPPRRTPTALRRPVPTVPAEPDGPKDATPEPDTPEAPSDAVEPDNPETGRE
jgi:hypothetical protein